MRPTIPTRVRLRAALLLLAALWGCDARDTDAPPAAPPADGSSWHYRREYLFVGERGGDPLVIPFVFRSADQGGQIDRSVHGWLARGAAWDLFLEEAWAGSAAGNVWQALPHGPLGLAVRGPLDVEALWYEQGDRRLRLTLDGPLTGWLGGERSRVRLLRGRLLLGQERLSGVVLEEYDVSRASLGAPPGQARDEILVGAGDSLRLLIVASAGDDARPRGFAWVQRPGEARTWDEVELQWTAARPLEEARRDVPTEWRFAVPAAGLTGELRSLGMRPQVGREQGGRREVEVRYTVEGWVEREGRRTEVTGAVRHGQG